MIILFCLRHKDSKRRMQKQVKTKFSNLILPNRILSSPKAKIGKSGGIFE